MFHYDDKKVANMRTVILSFIFIISWAAAQPTVTVDSLFSTALNTTVKYTVVLPAKYKNNQERFPTLYLLHGLGGNHSNWVTRTALVSYTDQYRFIIVCPDARDGWYTNSPLKQDAQYEDLIVKDVLSDVENKYRTLRSKYYRGIAGLSMGGYGAVKFGLKYPALFSFAAGMSPSLQFPAGLEDSVITSRWSKTSTTNLRELFGSRRTDAWNNEDIFYLIERANTAAMPYFYLSIGSQDGIIELPDLTQKTAAALRRKKIPFELHELPGGHDWNFWDREISVVLQRFNIQIEKR